MREMTKIKNLLILVILTVVMVFTGCGAGEVTSSQAPESNSSKAIAEQEITRQNDQENVEKVEAVEEVEEYNGKPYVVVNDNKPDFDKSQLTTKSYEKYSRLDRLGRCGVAMANVGRDIMPKGKRGSIGQVKPSGWHTVRYDDVISDKYLYNRCHLIGYQLTGENANEENLITGTRYLNVDGMLPFEDEVADYVKSTDNHVLYRVTPIFEGNNLVASGVQMEAMSVEDKGKGVCFNIYAYNVQPDIEIDYRTGKSRQNNGNSNDENIKSDEEGTFICNINSKKYHRPSCKSIDRMADKNKKTYKGKAQSLIDNGYSPCKNCNP